MFHLANPDEDTRNQRKHVSWNEEEDAVIVDEITKSGDSQGKSKGKYDHSQ